MKVAGLGVFPHLRAARASFGLASRAGNAGGNRGRLGERVSKNLASPRENRPFVPHLTLARVKARPPESLRPLLSRHAKTEFGTATIDQVELIRSELGPEGAKYTVLTSAPLGGGTAQHE